MTSTPTHPVDGTVTSADGTRIAYTKQASGPALVMVNCVGVSRATTPTPATPGSLAQFFTVYTYDRRGKGQSPTTAPYAVEREFEDLAAVIALADGPVTVHGFSSGGTLALLAAEAGLPMTRLALLEPPLFEEPDPDFSLRAEAQRRLDQDLADAHRWFNTDIVGVPEEILSELPPLSEEHLSNTRTIVHELTFLPGTPAERFAGVTQPTLVIASDQTEPVIYEFAEALVRTMPRAEQAILPGGWHGVDETAQAKAIRDFVARTSGPDVAAGTP